MVPYFVLFSVDNQPQSLWIWDLEKLLLVALIIQLSPIRQAKWSPVAVSNGAYNSQLAFCCGGSNVYLWSEANGTECVEIPTSNSF